MIRLAIIGTNWITQRFVDAALACGQYRLSAVYSRRLEQAADFSAPYGTVHCFDSLEALACSPEVDAVYIASPNALHCAQTLLMLRHGKHVICEKPLASTHAEAQRAFDCARANGVVLFEAFKTAYLPNFDVIRSALPHLGRLRKAFLNYCQYSSRYPRYLNGENPNTFNLAFSNGSIMDIGFYCLASGVALFGEPQRVSAGAVLLDSGVDAHGHVAMHYPGLEVVLFHSKVSDSALPSEIQGEEGSLVIEHLSQCQRVTLIPRGGAAQEIGVIQRENTMEYEAQAFARLIGEGRVTHAGVARTLTTVRLLDEIRRQTGVVFPADRA
ncbi:Gfo/Idh/MocA family oxidoreductase [Edwardsiella ictaluri]|uniref:Gfo/Idh/MocA family oxidoreductase n=1 Tax=Edwardsiella ictaluri TaxID=67780 RepID=A0ABY8GCG7_EDWIC|nr:Gfo/Idh/MocA family oxidoreductase [Edwardsiella ictaluri]ELV7527703.1 Gfo/Idh/MocA family oxidoreductase [Edwardsiella ictaluri]KMQ79676.1 oxidoreductase [Edwardsiella ictaluri]KOO56384.1 oxidoreductase [Edwardsiella ictaluri]WFN95202.1 Gfo/Idh/MocA family oxidoreductase [Edwardsiella ictaluri]